MAAGRAGCGGWLVGVDDDHVVGVAADEEDGVGALGVQRGCRHDHPGRVKACTQRLEARALVGGGVHVAVGEHDPAGVVQRGQQRDRSAISLVAPRSVVPSAAGTRRGRRVGGRSRPASHAPTVRSTASASIRAGTRRMVASRGG